MESLSALDAEYGTRSEQAVRKILSHKGGEFDPHGRGTCLRRAAKVLFDAGIGFSLCFAGLGAALEQYMGAATPKKVLDPWRACMVDWPEREELLAEVAQILTAETPLPAPSFSDFDTDMPTMLVAYAKLLRERLGRPAVLA